MGTRADFYVGRGLKAKWLGSIAWDGFPDSLPADALKATSARDFRARVAKLLKAEDHGTTPDQGWPWPWNDSNTTDYAYAWDRGCVWGCSGGKWVEPRKAVAKYKRLAKRIKDLDKTISDWNEADVIEKIAVLGAAQDAIWYDAKSTVVFPDMSAIKKVNFGSRSGITLIGIPQ